MSVNYFVTVSISSRGDNNLDERLVWPDCNAIDSMSGFLSFLNPLTFDCMCFYIIWMFCIWDIGFLRLLYSADYCAGLLLFEASPLTRDPVDEESHRIILNFFKRGSATIFLESKV